MAASVNQILPKVLRPHKVSESGNGTQISRSLYFQCLAELSDGFGSDSDNFAMDQPAVSAHHVLVSLICQAFLVDHDCFEDLTRRILMLRPADRERVQQAIGNPESFSLAALTALLLTAISHSDRPASIAIDNVHLVRASGQNPLLSSLRHSFDKWHQTAEQSIPIILTGEIPADTTLELQGVLQVDRNTEYRGKAPLSTWNSTGV